ncbi:MAG: hypothetical protein IJ668_00435 [Selenomonadaceae bacterium]|nr:hypothetical protein [Selenomonadaceae bacterium]
MKAPNDFQIWKKILKLRGLYTSGMTVTQLIRELKNFPPDNKVIMYDPTGTVYPVTFLLRDSANKTAII